MKKILISLLVLLAGATLTQAQAPGASIDLLWEADTYTPMFYGGHSQITPGSMVKIVALPVINTGSSINEVKINDFQFDWTKDNNKIGSYSGRGKNLLIYQADTSGANVIKVTISTPQGIPVAASQIVLPVGQPKLVFYKEDPLAGTTYNHALSGTFNLTSPEVTLRAEPYFFSTASVFKKTLSYNWKINDQKIVSNPDDQQLVTLVAPEEGGGENTLSINVDSPSAIFQTAKNKLTVTFNQSNTGF